MPIRIGWDKYETALLIDACERVRSGEPKKTIVKEVSRELRNRAIAQGTTIDKLFRNENGIDLQMTKMEYLLTDGKTGLPGASRLFAEMVEFKRKNPREFSSILSDAKELVGREGSGKTIMSNNRILFANWLIQQTKMKTPDNNILSVLDECSDYAKKHGLSKSSIWEFSNAKTFAAFYTKLSGNRLYRITKKSSAQAFDKAYAYYRDFLISLEEGEKKQELHDKSSAQSPNYLPIIEQNSSFVTKIYDTLKQLSSECRWGVSVLAIYELIGGSLQNIKTILDESSWAEAMGNTYRFVDTVEKDQSAFMVEPPSPDDIAGDDVSSIEAVVDSKDCMVDVTRSDIEAAFCTWVSKKGMSNSTARSYSSAIRSAEAFAKEYGISNVSLTSSDYTIVLSSIDILLADKRFIAFNTQQHNRFSAAFRKLRDFLAEVARREEQLTSDAALEVKYPKLYRALYSISKVYDDPEGLPISRILALTGLIESKCHVVEFLDNISWAYKLSDGVYSFSKKAAQVPAIAEEPKNSDIIPNDFDRNAFVAVLMRRFQSGMEFDSIDLEIFRDTYSDLYDETLAFSDEELEKRLKLCGVMYKDRIFPADGIIDPATKERLYAYIENQFASGNQVLYYKAIFSDLSDAFAYCFSLTDETMLKAYLEFLSDEGQYFFFDSYMSKEANVEIDHSEELINFMLDAGKPISYEDIYAGLSHIDKDIIYREIHGSSKFVMNERAHYFHIDIFEFSQADEERIAAILNKEIDENGYAIWSKAFECIQEQLPFFLENNLYLSSLGIRNALSQFMSDRFNFEGEVISVCGVRLSMGDVFRLYAKHHAPFSDKQIYAFSKEVGSPIYFWALAEESVRVSKSLFVAKDQIRFDVDAVDKALETYLTSGYILIKEVDSFLVFPNVGYEWNEYLLESFLLHYSKKYALVNNGTSLNNVAGAIARKDGQFTLFVDVCAQVLADSNVELKKAAALNYLAEVNLITRRSYKEIESAMAKARRIRNRKG